MEYISLYHKGKTVATTVGSPLYEGALSQLQATTGGEEKFIPAGYANRPDLISNLFFAGPQAWWEVMAINGLSDPFESLNVGDRISLPDD
jgi:hypothetical protein